MMLLKKEFIAVLGLLFAVTACTKTNTCEEYKSITDKEIEVFYKNLPFEMPVVKAPEFADYSVKITDFGAVGDGQTLNSEAFNKAIDHVSEKGGGKVIVPEGIWFTGPFVMKSNVNLFMEKNSLVLFSPDFSLYPIIDAVFEGLNTKRCQSPISAKNAENIAITGYGVFNASGDAWRPVKRDKMTAKQFETLIKSGGVLSEDKKMWFPSKSSMLGQSMTVDQNVPVGPETDEEWMEVRDYLRPVLLSFVECKNVLLEGVTFENSPSWNLHPLMCENVIINNLTVRNPWYSQNGDGIDLESCKNSLIVNSNFDVGDDAICMKSGKNGDGWKRNMPTENVIVNNCVVYHGHGGFVVGSEMSGGIRNVSVKSCSFIGTDVGLRFKSTRGRGGLVENIYIEDINMVNIPTDPLLFDLFYGGKAPGEEDYADVKNGNSVVPPVTRGTPSFKDIYIKNVTCNGAKRAMYFNGLPEMEVQNVNIENSVIKSEKGAVINQTSGIKMENVRIDNTSGSGVVISNVDNAVFKNLVNSKGEKILIEQRDINENIKIEN